MSVELKNVNVTVGKVDKNYLESIKAVSRAFEAHSRALDELARSLRLEINSSASGIAIYSKEES